MNRDELIRMARQAGFGKHETAHIKIKMLEHFASLVAAHEREECAQIAEDLDYSPHGVIAAAIRQRSKD